MHLKRLVFASFLLFAGPIAVAQPTAYTPSAGENAPMEQTEVRWKDDRGVTRTRVEKREAARDAHGNAQGNQHDLAVDGAFEGQTVAVLQLYDFSFDDAREALKTKGFSVYRWSGSVPSVKELEAALAKSTQFWLISGDTPRLTKAHVAAIKRFFDAGHGVYIWGDNDPYYADANVLGKALMGVTMQGNLIGSQVVGLMPGDGKRGPGVLRRHLLTTGLEHLFEGITIATIDGNQLLTPMMYGSANNLVTAFYDRDGKRAIFDGGFTRLYNNWDSAGTGRYVKNAAAWLVNVERFGAAVVETNGKAQGRKP